MGCAYRVIWQMKHAHKHKHKQAGLLKVTGLCGKKAVQDTLNRK